MRSTEARLKALEGTHPPAVNRWRPMRVEVFLRFALDREFPGLGLAGLGSVPESSGPTAALAALHRLLDDADPASAGGIVESWAERVGASWDRAVVVN